MNDSEFVNSVILKLEDLLAGYEQRGRSSQVAWSREAARELSRILEMAYKRNHTALINKEDEVVSIDRK